MIESREKLLDEYLNFLEIILTWIKFQEPSGWSSGEIREFSGKILGGFFLQFIEYLHKEFLMKSFKAILRRNSAGISWWSTGGISEKGPVGISGVISEGLPEY